CSDMSRRCRRSSAWRAWSTRWCGAACPPRSPRPRSGGRHRTDRGCAPNTSTARTRTAATSPTTPSSSSRAHTATSRSSARRACSAAERALERRAEPMNALFVPPDQYPAPLLEVGWHHLVLNSAHDSSCACSHDDVVDAVTVRYQEARHIGEALVRDALHQLAT